MFSLRIPTVLHALLATVLLTAALFAILPTVSFAQATDISPASPGNLLTPSNNTDPDAGKLPETSLLGTVLNVIINPILTFVRYLMGLILAFASTLLDYAIELSIVTIVLKNITGIQAAWEVMRDFANLFFIFIILWIAISTILQLGGHSMKKMLATVMLVALMINFSQFISYVVIDAGNVMAVEFYNRTRALGVVPHDGIGEQIVARTNIHALVGAGGQSEGVQVAAVLIMSIIFFFITAGVFLRAAAYMIARTVMFMLLVVFSPLAFLCYALPGYESTFWSWWKKLYSYALLAPAFIIVMYLVLTIIGNSGFQLTGNGDAYHDAMYAVLQFIIIITLVQKGSSFAFSFADESGHKMASGMQKAGAMAGGYVGGRAIAGGSRVASVAGRQTVGRAGKAVLESSGLKEYEKKNQDNWKGKMAGAMRRGGEKTAGASFDLRNSEMLAKGITTGLAKAGLGKVNIGKGSGEGGFKADSSLARTLTPGAAFFGVGQAGEREQKALLKKAEGIKDPALRQQYLRDNMGKAVDPELEALKKEEVRISGMIAMLGDTGENPEKIAEEERKLAAVRAKKAERPEELEKRRDELQSMIEMLGDEDAIKNADKIKAHQEEIKVAETKLERFKGQRYVYDTSEVKDTVAERSKISSELKKKDAEKILKDQIKIYEDTADKTSTAAVEAIAKIGDAMKNLGPKIIGDLKEGLLTSAALAPHLTSSHLNQIHNNYKEGKYSSGTLEAIQKNIMERGDDESKRYLASPEGKRNLFGYNVPKGTNVKSRKLIGMERRSSKIQQTIDAARNQATLTGILDTSIQQKEKELEDLQKDIEKLTDEEGV